MARGAGRVWRHVGGRGDGHAMCDSPSRVAAVAVGVRGRPDDDLPQTGITAMNRDPFGPWSPGRRRLWIVTCLVVCFLAGPGFLRSLRPARDVGIDFFQEWSSAKNALSGLPIYGNHVEAAER